MISSLNYLELGLEIEYIRLKVFYIVFEELSNGIYGFPIWPLLILTFLGGQGVENDPEPVFKIAFNFFQSNF